MRSRAFWSDTFRCRWLLEGAENNVRLGSNAPLPGAGGYCTLCQGSVPKSKEVYEDSDIYESWYAGPS